jgi:hypothetical protein
MTSAEILKRTLALTPSSEAPRTATANSVRELRNKQRRGRGHSQIYIYIAHSPCDSPSPFCNFNNNTTEITERMAGPHGPWLATPRRPFDFVLPVYARTSAPPGAGSKGTAPASRAPRVAPPPLEVGAQRGVTGSNWNPVPGRSRKAVGDWNAEGTFQKTSLYQTYAGVETPCSSMFSPPCT